MGFIFLTLTIYQAEAAWWGERSVKFPNDCFSSMGKPLIHGPPSFSHHSQCSLNFPITPCCCAPPLTFLYNHPCVFIKPPSFLAHSPWLFPVLPIIQHYSLSYTSCPSSLFLPPLLLPSHTPQPPPLPRCLPFSFPKFPLPSLSCDRTLGTMAPSISPRWQPFTWGTTVAMPMAMKTSIRHMCCRWMVSSGSFLTYKCVQNVMCFVCATLRCPCKELFLVTFCGEDLKTVSEVIKPKCFSVKCLETKYTTHWGQCCYQLNPSKVPPVGITKSSPLEVRLFFDLLTTLIILWDNQYMPPQLNLTQIILCEYVI